MNDNNKFEIQKSQVPLPINSLSHTPHYSPSILPSPSTTMAVNSFCVSLGIAFLIAASGVSGFRTSPPPPYSSGSLISKIRRGQYQYQHQPEQRYDSVCHVVGSAPLLMSSSSDHQPQKMQQPHQKKGNKKNQQLRTQLKASSVVHPDDGNDNGSSGGLNKAGYVISKSLTHARQSLHKIIKSMDEVAFWRCAAVMFITSLFVFHKPLDAGLESLWTYLTTSSGLLARWFRHDHWEWLLAVMAFNVWIHGFQLADNAVLKAARRGQDHPLRKHRLQDRHVAQEHYRDLLQRKQKLQQSANVSNRTGNEESTTSDTIGANNVVAAVDMNEPPPMVTKHSKWHFGGYVGELWVYMVPLFIWDKLDPRRHRLLARFAAPTTLQVCRDITLSLLMYDILFFCGHFLMHKLPIFNKFFGHKKHHTTPEVRAGDIVRLSVLEQVLEVGFSIVAIRTLKSHPISRSIYNCIITFLLTELHCGFDFPWTPQNVVPFGFATGSRRHHYHHRYGRHYYQKFFCHVDRLFGFMQPDDGTVVGDSVKPLRQIAHKMSWPRGSKNPYSTEDEHINGEPLRSGEA